MPSFPPSDETPKEPCASVAAVYPAGDYVMRTVTIGGQRPAELREALRQSGVECNEAAETLFASELFTTSAVPLSVPTVELAVKHLGFTRGATMADLCAKAAALGLGFCPVELGPHLRLQYQDQPEGFWGYPETKHRAPPMSLTVISAALSEDDEFPKGFYLRCIKGTLWLRGYCSGAEHVYDAEDCFLWRVLEEVGDGAKTRRFV